MAWTLCVPLLHFCNYYCIVALMPSHCLTSCCAATHAPHPLLTGTMQALFNALNTAILTFHSLTPVGADEAAALR